MTKVKQIKYTCGVCSNRIKYMPGAGTSEDLIRDIKNELAFPIECSNCLIGLCDDCVISNVNGDLCYECHKKKNGKNKCKHCGLCYATNLVDENGAFTCLVCDVIKKAFS